MRILLCKLLLLGCCLSACQLQASEVRPSSSPPNEAQIQALQTEFEQEMKTQLAQKSIDDYSFNEISDIAAKASQKIYGAHPQLMKQKVLFDLQQLSVFDPQKLSKYQVKASMALTELQNEIMGRSKPFSSYDDFMPLFYKKNQSILPKI